MERTEKECFSKHSITIFLENKPRKKTLKIREMQFLKYRISPQSIKSKTNKKRDRKQILLSIQTLQNLFGVTLHRALWVPWEIFVIFICLVTSDCIKIGQWQKHTWFCKFLHYAEGFKVLFPELIKLLSEICIVFLQCSLTF